MEGLHLGVESYILRGEAAALPTPLQHLVEAVGFVLVGGVDGLHLILQGVNHAACEACADFGGDIFWWWFHGGKGREFFGSNFLS